MGVARLGAVLALIAGSVAADIQTVEFTEPTGRYTHGVLGDAIEWGGLRLTDTNGRGVVLRLPETRVFEDLTPRLWDVTGDGSPEVVVVESDLDRGARLSIYGMTGLIAATPYIGQRFRWLAPVGAADFDGDGRIEIAYVDRPHLRKTLRIWRFQDGTLREVAQVAGLTNHRIGDAKIEGGVEVCAGVPTLLTANADWSQVMATQFSGGAYTARAVRPYRGAETLSCP